MNTTARGIERELSDVLTRLDQRIHITSKAITLAESVPGHESAVTELKAQLVAMQSRRSGIADRLRELQASPNN